MKRLILIAALALSGLNMIQDAKADCFCACVDGNNRPVCDSQWEYKPYCPYKYCS